MSLAGLPPSRKDLTSCGVLETAAATEDAPRCLGNQGSWSPRRLGNHGYSGESSSVLEVRRKTRLPAVIAKPGQMVILTGLETRSAGLLVVLEEEVAARV